MLESRVSVELGVWWLISVSFPRLSGQKKSGYKALIAWPCRRRKGVGAVSRIILRVI